MSTATIDRELIERLPESTTLILRNVSWEEYETLLEDVGVAPSLRIAFDQGTLQIMTLSPEHENTVSFFDRLIDRLSAKLRIRILSFGSNTIKRRDKLRGVEPDACYYVQSAALLGPKRNLDFTKDPPPDIAVEIDVHHESLAKFSLYAGLGVRELWHFDGASLSMYRLEGRQYVSISSSVALPMLDPTTLTRFLNLLAQKDQYDVLAAFDEWLDSLPR
jgi:Uma2 family endonuclease